MNLVQIDAGYIETPQTGLGRLQHFVVTQMVARDFSRNEYFIAHSFDGLSNNRFSSIGFRGIDQRRTQGNRLT